MLPLGCAAAPKSFNPVVSDKPHLPGLRLLRSRTGASPLATGWGSTVRPALESAAPAHPSHHSHRAATSPPHAPVAARPRHWRG
ncbi:hypothetical protein EI534_13805 [Pseudomonas frederiksbergensis]|nr:hypothetical protein [Pseudomonas frederiksbergensis]